MKEGTKDGSKAEKARRGVGQKAKPIPFKGHASLIIFTQDWNTQEFGLHLKAAEI